ncbi:RNA-binding protein 42 [Mucuna pruriens]|uniref:RNA-binding protein 42 n=1 Tax=Mucuna pruriens TaxID=157652 RepID=A0A371ICE7_MUCPR|nr:RNA-binding protein 42 [Mucuna pruriens]
MTTPSSSSASQSQFVYSNTSYFPVPFHLQQPATTHYAAPYVAAPSVQIPAPPVVGPVAPAPVAGVYSAVPQYQAQQLFERDAQIITPEALENVKAAIASSDVEHKADTKKKAVPRKAAGQSWEDPILAEWPEDDYRLFCGDLGNEVNDDVLSKAFSRFPSFNLARVVRDKRTGKTKGYGFVSFANPADLAAALKEMNGKYVGNRPIKLRKSKWRERTDYEALEKQKNHIQKKPKLPRKGVLHKLVGCSRGITGLLERELKKADVDWGVCIVKQNVQGLVTWVLGEGL